MTVESAPMTRARSRRYNCTTGVRWTGLRAGVLRAEGKQPVPVSAPMPDAEIASWTPEDLFIAAVNACTMTTFLALADRMAITVESYDSDAVGTLERVNNTFRFTEVVLRPRIVVADASLVDDTRKALEQAHQQCLVGNSIRGVLVLEPAITFLAED